MHMEDGKLEFYCKTVPYGFVAPDADVWYQNYVDTDEFGNQVERTYLMTTGYLWSGQFQELTKVIEEGQPHSMELDENSLEGHWATDNNLGVEFFIINDATFSKLCILGDDVEPCYEGSSVTALDFSQKTFTKTLFSMMDELKKTLENNKGGLKNMSLNEEKTDAVEFEAETEATPEVVEEVSETIGEAETADNAEVEEPAETPETDAADVDNAEDEEATEIKAEDASEEFVEEQENKETPEPEFTAEQFAELQSEIDSLRAENQELREFKQKYEIEQKQSLINSYYMLSDEDKADVISHISDYSYDDIKAKLAVIYVEKNVNFNVEEDDADTKTAEPSVTFSLDDDSSDEPVSELQRVLDTVHTL